MAPPTLAPRRAPAESRSGARRSPHYPRPPCSTSAASAASPRPSRPRSTAGARGGQGTSDAVDEIVARDAEQRRLTGERDDVRGRIKAISKDVGRLRAQGRTDEAEALMAASRELGEQEKALAAEADRLADETRGLLLRVPNTPSAEAPDGSGEGDNVVLRIEGWDPAAYADHQRVPHWEIGEDLGLLDIARATKISGSMFVMYRGWGARLLRAMVQHSLDSNADAYE